MNYSVIEFCLLLLYLIFFIVITNTRNGVQFLIITELIWVLLFVIYAMCGYLFESIYFFSNTFFLLILAAIDAGIWVLLLCFAKYYSNFFYKNTSSVRFMYRNRRLSYLNNTFI